MRTLRQRWRWPLALSVAALAWAGNAAVAGAQAPGAPPCPAGTKANFRFHYSADGKSGSWSKTQSITCPGSLTIGPQAMGDLKLDPGTTLRVGYDLTLPGNKLGLFLTVVNPQVVFAASCKSKDAPSRTFTVTLPTQPYAINNDKWYPTGDQKSSLAYQGSIAVPDLCAGDEVRVGKDGGATFTATVT